MPKPKNRSRSVKRKNKLFKRPKKTKVSCGICKCIVKKQNSDKSVKTKGKFGSNLCIQCSRMVLSYSQRIKEKSMNPEDISLIYQKYLIFSTK
ncbi:MAG: hypothetical protein WC501_03265 [Candidatus Micrarchaeia archaeon]